MNWKKRIAKEWLWLICLAIGDFIAWSIFFDLLPRTTFGEGWEGAFEDTGIRLLVISPIILVYFIRLTIWAIKVLRRKG